LANLLESHNVHFWLDFGTLLGAYRNRGFIPGDNDIDISLFAEDYWKVKKILELTEWKFKGIWRRELAVYDENIDYHIDLFFYERTAEEVCFYTYLKNHLTEDISVESKVSFVPTLLDRFTKIKFLNHEFIIPADTDEYLTAQYGDWRHPNPDWKYSLRPNIKKQDAGIAIIIPTYLRFEKLKQCVASIFSYIIPANKFQSFIKIYIGDQNTPNQEQRDYYDKLKKLGHEIVLLPNNCGLSYSRNELITRSKEPLILVIDDDFIFTKETKIDNLIRLLLMNENIGIAGGALADRKTVPSKIYLKKESNKPTNQFVYVRSDIKLNNLEATHYQSSVKYFYSEIIPNFFLAKREVFSDILWDKELKLAEHSDFFLRLKTTKWKVVFCPEVIINHDNKNNPQEYIDLRDRKFGITCVQSLKKLGHKYNIQNHDKNESIIETQIENSYLKAEKIKIVQMAYIPCANSGFELSNLLNTYSSKYQSRYILGVEYSGKNEKIPYRKFPIDLLWSKDKQQCIELLKDCDIVHVHHDIGSDPIIAEILKSKSVVWTLYNLTNSLQYKNDVKNKAYIEKVKMLSNIITVADQSAQKKLFSDISEIKVPLIKMLFDTKYDRNNNIPRIVFSPTNKTNEGIASKRYDDVLKIIEQLKQENYQFTFDLIEGVPYEENLYRKSQADIIIDDVDDRYEKWHNTSIEAACFGAVALTNYSDADYPFYKTNINTLKQTLVEFLTNHTLLQQEQQKMLDWKSNQYTPYKLLIPYEKIYTDIVDGNYTLKCSEIIDKVARTFEELHTTKKDFVVEVMTWIKLNNFSYCMINESVLENVFKRTNITQKIHMAVPSAEIKCALLNQFSKYCNFLDITIKTIKPTKHVIYYGIDVVIPAPTIRYLVNCYNKNYRQLVEQYGK